LGGRNVRAHTELSVVSIKWLVDYWEWLVRTGELSY